MTEEKIHQMQQALLKYNSWARTLLYGKAPAGYEEMQTLLKAGEDALRVEVIKASR